MADSADGVGVISLEESLDRIAAHVQQNTHSQILAELVLDEIDAIRNEMGISEDKT